VGIEAHEIVVLAAIVQHRTTGPLEDGQRACLGGGCLAGHVAAMDFEVVVSQKSFDRNSQVRFHKCMVATGLQKSLMHGLMHRQLFIHIGRFRVYENYIDYSFSRSDCTLGRLHHRLLSWCP
jgi:hypothetical protein